MSHIHSDPSTNPGAPDLPKHNQACLVLIPVSFASLIILFFYILYLRWQKRLPPRNAYQETSDDITKHLELGLTKDMVQMLTFVVDKESFSARDAQCSVCLGNYQVDDTLRQIPKCGHMFHDDCISHWLTTHTTCPLCRLSLQAAMGTPVEDAQQATRQQ